MSKQQKEKYLKFPLKDKKLARLFHNKHVSPDDQVFVNYIYEERQNFQFFYGLGWNLMATIGINHSLFRNNSLYFKTIMFGSILFINFIFIKKRIDHRYETLLIPYFEKYQVK